MSLRLHLHIASPTLQLILQRFRRFTYVTAHSPPFRRFTYNTAESTTLPPLHLRHMSFYNPSVASPTSQALQVLHLVRRTCIGDEKTVCGGLGCYSKLLSSEVATVLDSC